MVNQNTKLAIKAELIKQIQHTGSANKLSVTVGVSGATLSNIVNDKTALISDDMWRKVSTGLKFQFDEQWMHADTVPYTEFMEYYNLARMHASVFALVTNPGGGKSYSLDAFKEKHQNVFYVKCHRHTTERDFLKALLVSMHVNYSSYRITDMLVKVVEVLRKTDAPVIIIDEIEKVKNDVLMLIIDLYNELYRKAGIILIGTLYLKTRIETGVMRNKLGFNELLSRIGGKVIEVAAPSHADAAAVIRANGITNPLTIEAIITDSDNENNDVDLRRVERLVFAAKQREAA